MAAPRSLRPFLAPAKRIKVIAPRSSVQTFLRCRSDRAEDRDDDRESRTRPGEDNDVDIFAEMEKGDMTLEQRLEHMGIDSAEYKALKTSAKASQKKFEAWTPKSKAEAQKKWKRLADAPEDITLLEMFKREGVDVLQEGKARELRLPTDKDPLDPKTKAALDALRTPVNVQAVHLRPLRRAPTHGVPVCDLQLRTYSIRNLLLFADFAVRAAYYMGLCARGPIPLPRITERWTVPRANFIFKKSQENFERITMRRLIQIQDGHPDVVKAWLAFLQQHQYYGVGMKANIWEFESLDAATRAGYDLDADDHSRRREGPMMEKVKEILNTPAYKEALAPYESPNSIAVRPGGFKLPKEPEEILGRKARKAEKKAKQLTA
ncbi:hypothetical protein P171DRAFT_430468 [Karstenula rhodostoma CBS 690.94]|uniref:Small ribosomal subunit protein uS10m n=1 Tax=Karstenula rhodostoma CBS 690.94 TaxID=1392251 RepID=A0A9P4PLM3_9PLEO|nr:hypothetical protein P171DRAFT_430468 [Karstenula rhodostoma CBS 690.94]